MWDQNDCKSQNLVWQILIQANAQELPVKISSIVQQQGIILCPYSKSAAAIGTFSVDATQNDGFCTIIEGKTAIFYDDARAISHQRFVIAHELGHILAGDVACGKLVGREFDVRIGLRESAANLFASRILAPACVLYALEIYNAADIAVLCGIPLPLAQFCLKRMSLLDEKKDLFLTTKGRGRFFLSPLERQVYQQFLPYIKRHH